MLINNDLIWVPVPKCASFSIETSMVRSTLHLENYNRANKRGEFLFQMHTHPTKKELEKRFGIKETMCVRRDWSNRWFSCLRFFWQSAVEQGMTPIINYDEIDNDFIYSIFNKKFSDTLNFKENGLVEATQLLIKENIVEYQKKNLIKNTIAKGLSHLFLSQYWYTNSEKCTYEFDINNMNELDEFIYKRYGVEIKITENNVSN
jgi:hypothetical protein